MTSKNSRSYEFLYRTPKGLNGYLWFIEAKCSASLGCGFDVTKGPKGVPPSWVYTRFFSLLFKNAEYVDLMFDELVEPLRKELEQVIKDTININEKGINKC